MDDKLLRYNTLIELTKTTDDVVTLDDEIGLLLQSLYHVEIYNFEEVLQKFVRIRIADEIRKLLQAHSLIEKDDIKDLLSDAYKTICALPMLRVILAIEPSESIISNISFWARNNLQTGILLDLTLDRNLIGGAQMVYEGRIYDFSIRKKLREIFAKGDLSLG